MARGLDIARQKAEEVMNRKLEQAWLPGVEVPRTPDGTAPMNNHLARTNLFSPIRVGARAMLDNVTLAGPEGVVVRFSGKRLDMADQDVFLHALNLAAGVGPRQKVKINRASFLKAIGRGTGNKQYEWLSEAFFRLAVGRVEIETDRYRASYPLLGALLYDKEEGEYYFTIPEESFYLFTGKEYGYVSAAKRFMLEQQVDLAKWLQAYACSHRKGEHRVSVVNLHTWSGHKGRMRDFARLGLPKALDELVRVGELKEWSYADAGKTIVRWERSL